MTPLQQARALVEAAWQHTRDWESNYKKAQALLEGTLRTDPENVAVLTAYGAVLSDQGLHTEAVAPLEQALALGSTDRHTTYNLAVALINLRKVARAKRLFDKAGDLQASSDTWEAYFDPHGAN